MITVFNPLPACTFSSHDMASFRPYDKFNYISPTAPVMFNGRVLYSGGFVDKEAVAEN